MDEAQFKAEAQRLRPMMMAVACHYLTDSEAEDVVQDCLLRLWQMRSDVPAPIDRLAHVLVRNRAVDQLRRSHPSVSFEQMGDCLPTDTGSASAGEETERRYRRVISALTDLPPMQQTVIRLRHMEEMSFDDIAKIIGTTPQAVRQMVSRARRSILMRVKDRQGDRPAIQQKRP